MAKWLLLLLVLDGPVGAPPLVLSLPVLRYIIITWHTFYSLLTQKHTTTYNDVCKQQHSVLHTFDELSPFSLSIIPYRRSAPSSWSALP